MLINELLKKDPAIFSKEDPLIILYSKSYVCMDKDGQDNNNKRHIDRRVHFVRKSESCKYTRLTGVKEVCNWKTL